MMFINNAKYTGVYLNSNLSVYHFKVTSDAGNFEIYIHTGNNNKNNFSVNTSGECWFVNNNGNTSSLTPYGVFVKKI